MLIPSIFAIQVFLVATAAGTKPPPTRTPPTITTTEYHTPPKIWVLLIAGSSGYYNYRHQADVCHAYQIMRRNGIPEENIIVMMYDDIAYNPSNPTPGKIINQPNGSDVYKGVKIDYGNETVTPENFLNILQGKKEVMQDIGTGRVIESRPDDYIFVNFVDHGGPGTLGFPEDVLAAVDLIEALNNMTSKGRFKKMVMYVEACHSGSMFDSILPDYEDIFIMTAADPNESSYACYWDEKRSTYLGDVFSVNWMHQAEIEKLDKASLNHLFEKVRTNTSTSHVEEYGDLDIGNTLSSNFIGFTKKFDTKPINFYDPNLDSIPQSDVALQIIENKLQKLRLSGENTIEVIQLMKKRKNIQKKKLMYYKMSRQILDKISNSDLDKHRMLENAKYVITTSNMYCHKEAVKALNRMCIDAKDNDMVFPLLQSMINACSVAWTDTVSIVNAIEFTCYRLIGKNKLWLKNLD